MIIYRYIAHTKDSGKKQQKKKTPAVADAIPWRAAENSNP